MEGGQVAYQTVIGEGGQVYQVAEGGQLVVGEGQQELVYATAPMAMEGGTMVEGGQVMYAVEGGTMVEGGQVTYGAPQMIMEGQQGQQIQYVLPQGAEQQQ